MIKKILISIAIFILAFIGIQSADQTNNDCINLYIDYGQLDGNTKLTKCIQSSTKIIALDVLRKENLEIEGTKKYGLGVVCRVNGLPDVKVESCEVMPPENAYWAIIIKERQVLPFPRKEWGWGQLAIDQQYLKPGDSIGLVWTGPEGELKFP